MSAKSSLPWVLIGDFNDILTDEEKEGGLDQPLSLMYKFCDAISTAGLSDVDLEGC